MISVVSWWDEEAVTTDDAQDEGDRVDIGHVFQWEKVSAWEFLEASSFYRDALEQINLIFSFFDHNAVACWVLRFLVIETHNLEGTHISLLALFGAPWHIVLPREVFHRRSITDFSIDILKSFLYFKDWLNIFKVALAGSSQLHVDASSDTVHQILWVNLGSKTEFSVETIIWGWACDNV